MKVIEYYKSNKWTLSFEFFPPKKPEDEKKLDQTFAELKPLRPSFASITYGAMGTTREKTVELAVAVKKKLNTESVTHITCVSATRDQMDMILDDLKMRGIENILALRGDPPEGEEEFKPPKNGFRYANELVEFIRMQPKYDFCIGVAGYPGGHIECADPEMDLKHLKNKVNEGADYVITQLFFINEIFYEFVESARKLGITTPIIPGILPVLSLKQLEIFSSRCGVKVPPNMRSKLERLSKDKGSIVDFGIEYATKQCEDLIKHGVPGFHFYTLNKSHSVCAIYKNLNLGSRLS